MKEHQSNISGVLLLGGSGSRLHPLTDTVNKHLLPIYNKPLALHSLELLERSGIDKIVVVSNPREIDMFAELFGANKQLETEVYYAVQGLLLGTANAIKLGKKFITEDSFFSLWGDNIFEFNLESSVKKPLDGLSRLHLTRVDDPQNFGVVNVDNNGNIKSIEDKPQNPKSHLVCTGFMSFKSEVFEMINEIQPNSKGEYDIMDTVRAIHTQNTLEYAIVNGYWMDAGVSFDTLLAASILVKEKGINKKYA